jgi:molybdate transport system substrate-binding protein
MLKQPSRGIFWAALALASLCFASGCARQPPGGTQGVQPEINVAAASNLTDAFEELAKQFTAETGVRVVYSFGATADLAKQIENGAPFDVFASADVSHVDQLNGEGLLTPGARSLYARGRLVLWTPPRGRVQVSSIADITRPEVSHIAVAKPDVAPYGQATVEALRALNLWGAGRAESRLRAERLADEAVRRVGECRSGFHPAGSGQGERRPLHRGRGAAAQPD